MVEGGVVGSPQTTDKTTLLEQINIYLFSYYLVAIFFNLMAKNPMNIALFLCYLKLNIKGDPLPRPALVVRIIHYMYQKYAVQT